MKIQLILDTNPFTESSASANRWLTLLEGLLRYKNLEINLILFQDSKTKEIDYVTNLNIKYVNAVNNSTLWHRRWNKYIGKFYQNIGLINKIEKEINQFEPDIIWTSSSYQSFKIVQRLKVKQKQIPFFLEMSEFLDIYKNNKGNFLQKKAAKKRQVFFEQYAIHFYSGLALMTKTLYSHYEKMIGQNIKLLHLPMTVDLERFTENRPSPESFISPYIVFVGVMNNAKDGVDILIEAFAKIADKYSDLKLYLVGPWNYDTPAHLSRIKELKLIDRIIWKGEFPRDIIPSIIKNAKLLVLPRPDSKQAQGGFPTKLGEYLATANPVCATTVGELPLYLKDNESVFFAEPGSIDSFAETMNRALQNYKEAQKVGEKGREVAIKSFNKNIQGEILYNFFKQLIDENKK